MIKKCGYVGLFGRPNAGKSTFLNACVGAKLAVVSNKPQTTRNKILGVYTEKDAQALLLDTPGMHKTTGLAKINQMMNKVAWSTLYHADIVCYLIDATQGWDFEDSLWIENILKTFSKKFLILVTKSDKLKITEAEKSREKILCLFENLVDKIKKSGEPIKPQFIEHHLKLISSKKPDEIKILRNLILDHLPCAQWLYDQNELTDKSQKFLCSEMIREQLFRQLGQELPYKTAVTIDKYENKTPSLTKIFASVIVERESHKRIIIGNRGIRIKNIGMQARTTLEHHLGHQVFLELFVKVKNRWTENTNMLSEFADLQDPDQLTY
jgi:GTP-binding protein Era